MMRRISPVIVALAACTTTSLEPAAPQVARIAVVTGLGGTTEPCGCTSDPLGGLDRLAARIEALGVEGPTDLLLVGDTFYEHGDPPAHLFEQERKKAEVIAAVLARLNPAAIDLGPRDLHVQREHAEGLIAAHELPAFAAPKMVETRFRADSTVREVGGIEVGYIGVPADAVDEASAYTAGALSLRKQGAEVVIALVPHGGQDGVTFVGGIDAINIAITAGDDELRHPRMVGGTLVLEAGNKGQYLGVLELHPIGGDEWVYYDQGNKARRSLQARIDRLEGAVGRMDPGPALDARKKKLTELRAEHNAISVPPPPGNYVTWRAEPLQKKLPTAPWATALLADYNRSLCDIGYKATAKRECQPATSERETYVGNDKCGTCHPDALAVWKKTKHALAWGTLETAGKQCDVGCIGCHTVGWEQAGGYCRLADAAGNRDVGCENCHGPGAGHVAAPFKKDQWGAKFTRGNDATTCVGCHNKEHSDLFDFETYLPKILGPGHGQPIAPSP